MEGNIDEVITVRLKGYEISGTVEGKDYYGQVGSIRMDDTFIDKNHILTKEVVGRHVNDSGFGLQSIEKAHVDIYAIYEHGCNVFLDHMELEEKHLKNAKRGI